MSDQTLFARAQSIAKLDRRPLTDLPSLPRLAAAGLVAIIGSLLADAILVALAKDAFNTPTSFGPSVWSAPRSDGGSWFT